MTSPQIYTCHVIEPKYKNHLCIRTIFCWSLGLSLYTNFTVVIRIIFADFDMSQAASQTRTKGDITMNIQYWDLSPQYNTSSNCQLKQSVWHRLHGSDVFYLTKVSEHYLHPCSYLFTLVCWYFLVTGRRRSEVDRRTVWRYHRASRIARCQSAGDDPRG